VVKPAEQTPLSALALAELARRADIPPGVFNVVTGNAERSVAIGQLLCASETVRHLSFTGSTEVGRILMRQSASTVKKLSLELGGNAPFIVFDDADIDSAVEGALASKYRNTGQTCVCANRFYVQEGVYDDFVQRLAERTRSLRVGNGFEPGVMQGPLIDDDALDKVERHVANAQALGARVVAGGQRIGSRFYEPTVLADVTGDMLCAREETFGPLAPVYRFTDEADVIEQANATEYGLAAYFYARDLGRVFRVAEELEYGMVGINTGLLATEVAPFGGVKESGIGREGSRHGMEEFTELKYMLLAGLDR
jgi:succinate-semialdehyde dehydrogenase/glutarate-semialdehyde dehydrogenase